MLVRKILSKDFQSFLYPAPMGCHNCILLLLLSAHTLAHCLPCVRASLYSLCKSSARKLHIVQSAFSALVQHCKPMFSACPPVKRFLVKRFLDDFPKNFAPLRRLLSWVAGLGIFPGCSGACVCCALGLAKIFFKRVLTALKSILPCFVYLYINGRKSS